MFHDVILFDRKIADVDEDELSSTCSLVFHSNECFCKCKRLISLLRKKARSRFILARPFLCCAISLWLFLDEKRCDNQNNGQPNLNIEHCPETIVNIVERLVYCCSCIFQRSHVYVIIPKHNQQQMRKSPI